MIDDALNNQGCSMLPVPGIRFEPQNAPVQTYVGSQEPGRHRAILFGSSLLLMPAHALNGGH